MKKLMLLLLALTIAVGAAVPAGLAEGAGETAGTAPAAQTEGAGAPAEGTEKTISVRFGDPGCPTVWTWDFPYSDEWFLGPEDSFSRGIARGSLGLVASAFMPLEKQTGLEPQYETYLSGAGFEDIHTFGYDQPKDLDTFAGVMGRKQIGGFTLIAVAGRGSGYGAEWGGNLRLGSGKRHEGFDIAAGILKDELDKYLADNAVEGPIRLWVTGYSRSAAVGNLAAADWTASGRFERVYGYFFACPRNTQEPADCPNLFNISGAQDFVPQIPMEAYGYERNGQDLYLPSQETTAGYARLQAAASEILQQLHHRPLTNNPQINLMFRLLVGMLNGIYRTQEEYVTLLQDKALETIPGKDLTDLTSLLPGIAASILNTKLPEGRTVLSPQLLQLGTYLTMMLTMGHDKWAREGIWDPETDAFINTVREHLFSTYLCWVFSGLEDGEIFTEAAGERICFIGGCRTVTVSRGDEILWTTENSTVRKESENPDGYVFIVGNSTAVIVPADGDYRITAVTRDGKLRAAEILMTPAKTFCDTCICYASDTPREQAYEITAVPAGEDSGFRTAAVPCGAAEIIDLMMTGFISKNIQTLFAEAFGTAAEGAD